MTCIHCGRDAATCKGYLVLLSAIGTQPLVYGCYPSCNGFPYIQGNLWDVQMPAAPSAAPEASHE